MSDSDAREETVSFMLEHEVRPEHARHVSALALQLFDQLAALHELGQRESLLLEAAALLHDIGHGAEPVTGGHHRESARMIREHSWKCFAPPEVEIIAQVARYHRKGMPENAHEEFVALTERDRRIVQRLAALLRLADAFDRSHGQHIQRVRVELPVNKIDFHLESEGPVLREVMAARIKGDLAQAVFQRDLRFMFDGEEIEPPEGT